MENPYPLQLLVVEDDRAVARAVARLLRRRGHAVHLAHGYEAALSQPGRYDCGIFDVDLPDGSGIDLAQDLLAERRVRRCVFFSASPDSAVQARAMAVGAFVHKTEGVGELARAVAGEIRSERHARKKVANGHAAPTTTPPVRKSGFRPK